MEPAKIDDVVEASTSTLAVRVPCADAENFKQKCAELGLSPSEMLRKLILRFNAEDDEKTDAAAVPVGGNEHDPIEHLKTTISLRKTLKDGCFSESQRHGLSVAKWLALIIQTTLTKNPTLPDQELGAVRSSKRELNAIGRNLNQITKAINEAEKMGIGLHQHNLLRREHITLAQRAIDKLNQRIDALVDARYWVWSGHDAVQLQFKKSTVSRVSS